MTTWLYEDYAFSVRVHGGHKFSPENKHLLDNAERRLYLKPESVLMGLGLQRSMTAVDIGAGTGFFSLPMARIVGPRGKVFAVDIEGEMINELRLKIQKRAVWNVEVLSSTEDHIDLPDSIADFVLLACVLHELEGLGTLHEARRILRPNGVMGVVDWRKVETSMGPPIEHRLSEAEAASLIQRAGFRSGETTLAGPYHYSFVGNK